MMGVAKRLIDIEEYYKMAEVGILKPTDNVELVNGEIIEISPIGSEHASIVNKLSKKLIQLFDDEVVVSIQSPVRLNDVNEPEPDIAILKPDPQFYSSSHPGPKDIFLIIEVSDSTYSYDKELKSSLYAKNSIPEYWIIDIKRKCIEIYSSSDGEEYLKKEVTGMDDQIKVLTKQIAVNEIFN